MKKHLFFAATALAMLASCSQSDDLSAPVVAENTQPQAIEFGTYVGKNVNTRAGQTGSITSAQVLANKGGFGVFAYYTGDNDYLGTTSVNPTTTPVTLTTPQASAMAPNFMYNQQIEGTDATTPVWTYSPVKYWPNGNTTADDQDNNAGDHPAEGSLGGKVSFFAYAPYVTKAAADGTGTGIISMSDNSATGNPTITYKMQAGNANPVDLLWGTAGTNGYKAQDGTVDNSGNYIAVDPGTPKWADRPFAVNANLTKMKVQGKVQFAFKHALAKVGGSNVTTTPPSTNGLQVMLDVDNGTAETGGTYDNTTTKVTVSDITITARAKVDADATPGPDKYLTPAGNQGTLDLATGQWTIDVATSSNVTADKATASSVTHQITTSGSGSANASLNTTIAEPTTALATGTAAWDGLVEGVLTTAKNVYADEANPLVYIPGTYPELDVEITYITRTKDASLAKGYSEVPQTVKKTLTFTKPVQLNKQYNLIIRLGLTSVKFDATVSDWDPDTDSDGDVDGDDTKEINLPINVSD